jgi:hypothetical protein
LEKTNATPQLLCHVTIRLITIVDNQEKKKKKEKKSPRTRAAIKWQSKID